MAEENNLPPPSISAEKEGPFTPHDICRVAVRPPPFWPEEPGVWFAQLEGNFHLSGIKDDETKFYYVTSTLDQRYASEIKDIITSPPKEGKYEKLKTTLIKRLSASREKEVKQLLQYEELGDRRPSQFLRHLQRLAGPSVPNDFLQTIWCSRLPSNIQTVIASQQQSTLEALADLADKVHDIVPSTSQVAATSAAPGSALEMMAKQINELTKQVQALAASGHRRSRSQTRRNYRNHSNTRSHSNHKKHPQCWFHWKFGNQARKCIKPCDFKPSGNQQGNQ